MEVWIRNKLVKYIQWSQNSSANICLAKSTVFGNDRVTKFQSRKKGSPPPRLSKYSKSQSWRNTLASDSSASATCSFGHPSFLDSNSRNFHGRSRQECGEQHGLGEVTFERMIPLGDGEDRQLMTTIAEDLISIHSSVNGNDWVLHATARILKHARSIRSSSNKQTSLVRLILHKILHYRKWTCDDDLNSSGHLEK